MKDKNKMLILQKYLTIGGIEKAFLSFINELKDEFDIEVCLFHKGGGLEKQLSPDIKTYEANKLYKLIYTPIQERGSKRKVTSFFKKILIKTVKAVGGKYVVGHLALRNQKQLNNIYDIAIAFDSDVPSLDFLLNKVKAKKKFAFIHGDIRFNKISKLRQKKFLKFDKVFCVSKSCADICKAYYPLLKERIDYLYNFQDVNSILKAANEILPDFNDSEFNIVSVSRLSKEKGYIRTLNVMKNLKEKGYKFSYHIVGDGIEKSNIIKFINKNNMQSYVNVHGAKPNPYPYIKSANLLLLSSYNESFGLVLVEAMILNTPLLTTENCSSKELVGEYGIICQNSKTGLAQALENLLNDHKLLNPYREKLKNYKYNNLAIKEKFLKICTGEKS